MSSTEESGSGSSSSSVKVSPTRKDSASSSSSGSSSSSSSPAVRRSGGVATNSQQIAAMIRFRLVAMKRMPDMYCFVIIQPVIFWLAVALISTLVDPRVPKPELIEPAFEYNDNYKDEWVFVQGPSASKDFAKEFKKGMTNWGTPDTEVKSFDDRDQMVKFFTSDTKDNINYWSGSQLGATNEIITDQDVLPLYVPELYYQLNQTANFTANSTLPPCVGFSGRVLYNTTLSSSLRAGIQATGNGWLRTLSGDPKKKILASYFVFPGENPFAVTTFSAGGLMYIGAIALAMMAPSFAINMVDEKEKRIRHLLFVEGLTPTSYWLGSAVADFCLYLITALIANILMGAFRMEAFITNNYMGYFLLFFTFGVTSVPFGYAMSLPFNKKETAEMWLTEGISMLVGVPWILTTFAFPEESTIGVHTALSVIPGYGLYYGLAQMEGSAKLGNPFTFADVFDFDKGVIGVVLLMLANGIISLAIIVIVDGRYHVRWFRMCMGGGQRDGSGSGSDLDSDDEDEESASDSREASEPDDDVVRESGVVESMRRGERGDYDVIIDNIRMEFAKAQGSGKMVAVDSVSFGVKRGELFGLLGVNGAGKTTLINIITGYMDPTDGSATMAGYPISTHMGDIRQRLGVCQQFDALYEYATAKEHLQFYAGVKGMVGDEAAARIQELSDALELGDFLDKPVNEYSGGTKRKLSVAISLIGNPEIVIMDEPSTGMDPGTRRLMWSLIQKERKGRVIILTTHSMEEADALCTRLCIMVNGQIKCIGSSQHLKTKFGSGYRVAIQAAKFHPDTHDKMIKFVNETFEGATLKQFTAISWDFMVPVTGFKLASAFEAIEGAKEELGIADYMISQTTLEQVFIDFAKKQRKGTD